MGVDVVDPRSVLSVLTGERLVELGRALGIPVPQQTAKKRQVDRLLGRPSFNMASALREMTRAELREACRMAGLDDSGRARIDLTRRLVEVIKVDPALMRELEEAEAARQAPRDMFSPQPGDITVVRQRQYLVESVKALEGGMTLVRLACLDDDAAGRKLEVLWELELGARVLDGVNQHFKPTSSLDSARRFSAYFHALKWNSVTATQADLFQAPFRAGIQVWSHQLIPLQKALQLPRANLFIADDVGLGKTIEAGLVLQELKLRQRVDFSLIICPASVALQWREEMKRRFGLHFEVYNRHFVTRRRQERGFGVNPWATHTRFIVSYHTVRRPEHRDPLIQHLGDRTQKSLLILDEAHTVAPSSASRYAVDSQLTRVARDLAPRFENRLFLSATPHNGHSNSFSALLELLDPQRFTRGVKVSGPEELDAVMVRRLKSDLAATATQQSFPERKVVTLELAQRATTGSWSLTRLCKDKVLQQVDLGENDFAELRLASMLSRYTELRAPETGRGKLVFINLQKRLLSSIEAFYRTLRAHARRRVEEARAAEEAPSESQTILDLEVVGETDEAAESRASYEIAHMSAALPSPTEEAQTLLKEMMNLADAYRERPDAKSTALLHWIRENQCPNVGVEGTARQRGGDAWSDTRLIIFTEYGDTMKALYRLLNGAIEGTDQAPERIMRFHGGMSEEARADLRRAFNTPPAHHPVRILIATDAAREGVNLQAHCADLIHFDIPWNPSRIEQRNGRIDRTLQPSREVRCMVFHYPDRAEDRVLKVLIKKVGRIQRELGSLGAIIMDRMGASLESRGINSETVDELDKLDKPGAAADIVKEEMDGAKEVRVNKLKKSLDAADKTMQNSRKIIGFDSDMLQGVLSVGLELANIKPLTPCQVEVSPGSSIDAWRLPEDMPEGWEETLDTLRPLRGDNEPFWEWRQRQPQPVVFSPPKVLTGAVVHLHLEHPFVRRVLARFRAQGFAHHDLKRVAVFPDSRASQIMAVAIGRLSIFGPGATRLHDKLVMVAAPWLESGGEGHLETLPDAEERAYLERLPDIMRKATDFVPAQRIEDLLLSRAKDDFATLWPEVEQEAEEVAMSATKLLTQRGVEEANALRAILMSQRERIQGEISQTSLLDSLSRLESKDQARQRKLDVEHMKSRYERLNDELRDEPQQLQALYEVALKRVEPVGMIYLWPTTR